MSTLKRLIAPLLTLLLLAGVGTALYQSIREQWAGAATVEGLIGSEKEEFFRDPG